jgi:hypothetical protein
MATLELHPSSRSTDDAPTPQRLYGRLSKQSIHLRFFGYMKQLPDHIAKHLACVDGINRSTLVALDPNKQDEIIAVVRFDREVGTCKAEYASLVEVRWQGRGLGLGMTRRLILIAHAVGVRCLYGLVMRGNKPMLALLRCLDLPGHERLEKDTRLVEASGLPPAGARRAEGSGPTEEADRRATGSRPGLSHPISRAPEPRSFPVEPASPSDAEAGRDSS